MSERNTGFRIAGAVLAASLALAGGARAEEPPCGICARTVVIDSDLAQCFLERYPQLVSRAGGAVAVKGSTQAAVGATVCRSGSTTGWHCGQIQGFNSTVRYAEGSVSGLIRTNVCAEPGDSGGSLLAGNQAQGVTSGGSGDCTSGGTTYFQPVNEILQTYGLRLLTS